ncbi:unnamed protein product [Trichobilharzia szidati]|nr:unnamed protein product [Trichobilharzia szidati]
MQFEEVSVFQYCLDLGTNFAMINSTQNGISSVVHCVCQQYSEQRSVLQCNTFEKRRKKKTEREVQKQPANDNNLSKQYASH